MGIDQMLKISGAVNILQDTPLTYIHPMHLVRSQNRNMIGFIAVTYESWTDIFFIKSNAVFDVGRMTPDFRFRVDLDTALQNVAASKSGDGLAVLTLSRMPENDLKAFRRTFYLEPCLKIYLKVIDRKGLLAVREISSCSDGMIEANGFNGNDITIDIMKSDVVTPEHLNRLKKLSYTRLLIYDEKKNAAVFKEKFQSRYDDLDRTIHRFHEINKSLEDSEKMNVPVGSFSGCDSSSVNDQAGSDIAYLENMLAKYSQSIEPELAVQESSVKKETDVMVPDPVITVESKPSIPDVDSVARELSLSVDSYIQDVVKEYYDQFRVELGKLSDKAESILEKSSKLITEKYPDKKISLSEDSFFLGNDALLVPFEIMSDSINNFNPVTQRRLRNKLKEIILILLTKLYTEHYEILKKHSLLNPLSELYNKIK